MLVDSKLRRLQCRRLDKRKVVVTTELSGQPQERLLKIVIGFRGNVVVLQVLLAMESNLLGFDLAILDFDLVSAKYNRNILANASEVTMPVGHVLVGDAGGDIEHDDCALSLNVVSVAKAPKLLLPSSIPHIEFDGATIGVEGKGMDLHTQSRNVFLFKFASQVALDERSLSYAAIADQD